MKTIKIFCLFFLISISAFAQDVSSSKRDIPLKVLNKKGRPVSNIMVQSIKSGNAGMTDRNGLYVFSNMTDSDSITVILPRYGQTVIPVAEMDSIVVTLRSARLYSYENNEGKSIFIERDKTQPNVLMDIPVLLKQCSCNTLIELLQGRVAGLNLSNNQADGGVSASIRGTRSLLGSNEPLVVLDGAAYGTLNEANATLNVRDIKTIEVLKSASEWGVRGANGVIVITTK